MYDLHLADDFSHVTPNVVYSQCTLSNSSDFSQVSLYLETFFKSSDFTLWKITDFCVTH